MPNESLLIEWYSTNGYSLHFIQKCLEMQNLIHIQTGKVSTLFKNFICVFVKGNDLNGPNFRTSTLDVEPGSPSSQNSAKKKKKKRRHRFVIRYLTCLFTFFITNKHAIGLNQSFWSKRPEKCYERVF